MAKIIIVDDEQEILTPLEEMLTSEGFKVRSFLDPHKALDYLRSQSVDLAILDIKMPEMGGYELLKSAREIHPQLPVIFLSSKQEEQDQIIGFTLGADDFVGKPFSKHLLIFRIKSVLRRYQIKDKAAQKPIEVGDLLIDKERHLVSWKESDIDLTVTECMLLISLAERPGTVKKRDQLMDAAYRGSVYVSDRTIDSHIRNIRKKFSSADPQAEIIATVQGLGYKLKI